jgi:predicted metal-dependent hydrolase
MIFFDNKKKFEKLVFPEYVEVLGKKYYIEVVFFAKRSSSVVIKGDRLVFRLSSYLSGKKAEEHFSDLLKKIYRRISKSPVVRIKTISDVLEDMRLVVSDEVYEIEYSTRVRSVKFSELKFYVNPRVKHENVEKYFIKFLIGIYSPRVKKYVLAFNEQTYKYNVKDVQVKFVNSKWGHCTADDRLMFNLKLLNAPIEVFDYVVAHELAHIRYKNHSSLFWADVGRFCPDYKRMRKLLKESPPGVFK